MQVMKEDGIWGPVLEKLLARIGRQMRERVQGRLKTGCILISAKSGFLGQTPGAEELLTG